MKQTTINAKLSDVMALGTLAIEVHKTVAGIPTSLSCGDLPQWDPVNMKFKL